VHILLEDVQVDHHTGCRKVILGKVFKIMLRQAAFNLGVAIGGSGQ
jgi:hypothetical protein